jgi:hypothetical protein
MREVDIPGKPGERICSILDRVHDVDGVQDRQKP